MSNFVVAVGGSGAKLMQSLIHLGAAGLLPETRRELFSLLVDPDENNGNVEECKALAKSYDQCRKMLAVGSSDLFSAAIQMEGPWTPLRDGRVDSLKQIFQYDMLKLENSPDAELLDLMYEPAELELSIKQGFRGRPAIGATVLAESVRFDEAPWEPLKEKIKAKSAQGNVHVLLSGSVFGGSGAAGVPTLVRLLEKEFGNQVSNLRLGLVLFLPFFQFRPVPNEEVQADPAAFPMATAEALKYYHERGFLSFCHSIYCVGEEVPAQVLRSAVGASEQRNEAHFIELIAGMGAMRFFNDQLSSRPSTLDVAGRKLESTLTWNDLPYDEFQGSRMVQKLQQMVAFAVSYRYIFFPLIAEALHTRKSDKPFWVDHIERQKVDRDQAGKALRELNEYVGAFLTWLLQVATPGRQGFQPGMVNPNVFGVREREGEAWRLKQFDEFRDREFTDLFLNRPSRVKLDGRSIFEKTARPVDDKNAVNAGRLVRSIYDACAM